MQIILNEIANKFNAAESNTRTLDSSNHRDEASTFPQVVPPTPPLISNSMSDIASTHLFLSSDELVITSSLLAALPSRQDTEVLLRFSKNMSFCCQMINSDWQSQMTKEEFDEAPIRTPPMPNSKTHPVVLARLMLGFAVFLQSAWYHRNAKLSESPQTIRERLATAAIKLVTSNSDLHGSLDSLECIMMEGLYHTHVGNLRRAWTVYRRAISLAQLMGIHRLPSHLLRSIDPEATFYPELMWLRIIFMERYLSLLLGLPQGTNVNSSAILMPPRLKPEPPIQIIQRSLSTIAGRILERNELCVSSYSRDKVLDAELLKVSQEMLTDFWRPPNFEGISLGSFEETQETIRLTSQVFYFYLLNQLHLPYMLSFIRSDRFGELDRHEDYSTITCANASREILHRFIAYRNINHMALCFRPVDFTTLTAILTLLLAHLDVHLSQSQGDTTPVAKSFLSHQRLSDRLLLEEVLQKINLVSKYHNDALSIECAKIMRSLLKIEAAAAQGEGYQWKSSQTEGESSSSQMEDDDEIVLCFTIPSIGEVRISRRGRMSKVYSDQSVRIEPPEVTIVAESEASNGELLNRSTVPHSENISYIDHLEFWEALQAGANPDEIIVSEQALGYRNANNSRGLENWALQGVDVAFFDSLMMVGLENFDSGFDVSSH